MKNILHKTKNVACVNNIMVICDKVKRFVQVSLAARAPGQIMPLLMLAN